MTSPLAGGIRIDLVGDTLTVEVPERHGLFHGAPSVVVRLRCPHDTRLEVAAAAAEVRASGRYGGVEVKTASGDVAVEGVDGDARISTVSGDIRIERAEAVRPA